MFGVNWVVPENVTLSPMNPGPMSLVQLVLEVQLLSDAPPSQVTALAVIVSGVMI